MRLRETTLLKKSPNLVFKEGDMVLIPLDDVDCTKVDGTAITGVVVKIDNGVCTVAV